MVHRLHPVQAFALMAFASACSEETPTWVGPSGSVGTECTAGADCASGLCLELPATPTNECTKYCTEACDCPRGWACVSAGAEGWICAPGENACYPSAPPPTEVADEIDLAFAPSNLGAWAQGKPLLRDADVTVGCPECLCRRVIRFDTDTGRARCDFDGQFTTLHFEVFTQEGAPEPANTLGVFFMRSLVVDSNYVIEIAGSRPAVFVVQGPVELEGDYRVLAGETPGVDSYEGPARGHGPGGGGWEASSYSGAEGGWFCSSGGLGARMTTHYGRLYGTPELIPLLSGSSGATNVRGQGDSGFGGGALQIVSGEAITLGTTVRLDVSGGVGAGVLQGAGGGSGGSLLFEAPTIAIRGALRADGGHGAFDDVGGAGATGTADAEDGRVSSYPVYGGGGGGFGRIRLNTESGLADIAIDAIVSPAPAHGCTTIGTLLPRTSAPPPPPTCDAVTLPAEACGECLANSCCELLLQCESELLCMTCWTSDAPGPACASDPSTLSLQDCKQRYCPTACPP